MHHENRENPNVSVLRICFIYAYFRWFLDIVEIKYRKKSFLRDWLAKIKRLEKYHHRDQESLNFVVISDDAKRRKTMTRQLLP